MLHVAVAGVAILPTALPEQSCRHSLTNFFIVCQVGEATNTTLRAFTVCGEGQLHDLHSKLLLNHPEGQANQLHK